MREDFANDVQQAGMDPASSLYRERWLSAEQVSNERFSSLFGGDLFIKMQTQAAQAEAQRQAVAK
jgi:hypothetical protein